MGISHDRVCSISRFDSTPRRWFEWQGAPQISFVPITTNYKSRVILLQIRGKALSAYSKFPAPGSQLEAINSQRLVLYFKSIMKYPYLVILFTSCSALAVALPGEVTSRTTKCDLKSFLDTVSHVCISPASIIFQHRVGNHRMFIF